MEDFEKLLTIAKRKSTFDQNNPWYKGPETYLSGISKEVEEVKQEIPKRRKPYLEDELGDILWDYLNSVLALEKEAGISMDSVLKRACIKYEERIHAIETGGSWSDVKVAQKKRLKSEHAANSTTEQDHRDSHPTFA